MKILTLLIFKILFVDPKKCANGISTLSPPCSITCTLNTSLLDERKMSASDGREIWSGLEYEPALLRTPFVLSRGKEVTKVFIR